MKMFKLIGLALSMFSIGVLLTPSYARQNNPILGVTDEERNAVYEIMYNGDNVTHEVGDVVVYKDGTYDGIEISTTTTANNPLVAGVIADTDCAAATWCKVQIAGYHAAVTIGVANAAGDALVTSTTGEAAGVYSIAQATGTLTGQSDRFGVFAVALEATTSSTTVKAILFR